MLVGADTGSAITPEYEAPFRFDGGSTRDRRRQRRARRGLRDADEDRPRQGVERRAVDLKQLVVVAFQVSLFVIVFGYGLKAEFTDLLYLLRRPALLIRSLTAVLLVMPAVAVVLGPGRVRFRRRRSRSRWWRSPSRRCRPLLPDARGEGWRPAKRYGLGRDG